MATRRDRLVLALRVAYLIGAGLFLADIVFAGVTANIRFPDGGVILEADDAYDSLIEWIALIAFAFAALGAVLTVAATTEFTRTGIDGDHAFDDEVAPPRH